MSMCLQEILFQKMLVRELTGVNLPALVHEDNTGAIFLVKNQQVGARTKHIDVRYHFIREHYEAKEFEMKFVQSEDNEADIFTKSTPERVLKSHALHIRNGTLKAWRDPSETVETASAAWRENLKIDELDDAWMEVRRHVTKV
jgi:hypothetical protein